jgi:YfiH family protein
VGAVTEKISLECAGDGLPYCTVALARAESLPRAGISLLCAGNMGLARRASDPSYGRLLAALGVTADRARSVAQIHSRSVVIVDGQPPASVVAAQADGMATLRPDLLLTVTVADCLPIFLADRVSGAFAIVHSGWKGTGIVVDAIRHLAERFGTRARDLVVAIGPGIGPCCYTVPQERYEEFCARFGPTAVAGGDAAHGEAARGDFRLDLRRANIALLESEGVRDISVVEECTCCSPRLGSFRREGPGEFTRMLAFIGRWPERRT